MTQEENFGKKLTAKEKKLTEKTVKEILTLLEIDGDLELKEEEGILEVGLNTNDSGVVIGYHGEILDSLQLILSLCLSKKLGHFVRLSLEVGDYKKKRKDWLESIALEAKEKALVEKREVPIPDLRSWERRIVHVILKDDKEVVSESVGEGKERTLVVKPK